MISSITWSLHAARSTLACRKHSHEGDRVGSSLAARSIREPQLFIRMDTANSDSVGLLVWHGDFRCLRAGETATIPKHRASKHFVDTHRATRGGCCDYCAYRNRLRLTFDRDAIAKVRCTRRGVRKFVRRNVARHIRTTELAPSTKNRNREGTSDIRDPTGSAYIAQPQSYLVANRRASLGHEAPVIRSVIDPPTSSDWVREEMQHENWSKNFAKKQLGKQAYALQSDGFMLRRFERGTRPITSAVLEMRSLEET